MSWIDNIGHIQATGDGEYCWMLPCNYILRKFCVISPWFSFAGEKWRLAKMWDDKNPSYMGLYLWKRLSNLNHEYSVTLGITDTQGNNVNTEFYTITSDFGCGNWAFMDLRSLPYSPIILNGLIKIFCSIQRIENQPNEDALANIEESKDDIEIENDADKNDESLEAQGVDRLLQNLKNLLVDGQNSDVILKAGDREFPAHRGILGVRSPVFASMFQLEMKEKTSGVVDIPDCTAESFEVFLLYLYTGSAETMSSDNVSNLYYAADKYRVDDLKRECVQFMKDNMSVDNICDVVALCLKHTETGLLKEATRFFRENVKKIIKTVKWQEYLAENSTHANELLIKAFGD